MQMKAQATILVVDDEVRNTRLLQAQLSTADYTIVTASCAEEALERIQARLPDLILLDVMMPGMNGYELATLLKKQERTRNIPIIMITALDDKESRMLALEAGAEEFLNKPVDRTELWVRVRNLLRLKEYQDILSRHNDILERQVQERTRQLTEAYRDTVYTMVCAAEYKDQETGAHVQRIGFYCQEMAERMGMSKDFCDKIYYASPMHDIGKIAIADSILLKRGPFTSGEWEIMKSHSALGAQILARGNSPYLAMGVEIALNHHERWDGTGYPNGTAGEDIPISARIMNICDQYDALRSMRPYKPAFSHEKTVEILVKGDGRTMPGHFDPAVWSAFIRAADQLEEIYEANTDC